MNVILDERDAVALATHAETQAQAEAERQRGTTRPEAARAWQRFSSERGRSEAPRSAPVRWRDEEGL